MLLCGCVTDGNSRVALPELASFEQALESEGWVRQSVAVLSRDRPLVPFASSVPTAVYRHGTGPTLVQFTRLGGDVTGFDSVEIEVLFSRPLTDSFESDIKAFTDLLTKIGFGALESETALEVLRETSDDPEKRDPYYQSPIRQWVLGDIVLRSRGEFRQGPGGKGGFFQLQFAAVDAPELNWPTYIDVEQLQPADRYFEHKGPLLTDAPPIFVPDVTDLICHPLSQTGWRCRYRLFIDDWIAGPSPQTVQDDFFRRNSKGMWILVAADRD